MLEQILKDYPVEQYDQSNWERDIKAPKAYRKGQWKTLKSDSFDVEKAVNAYGIKEISATAKRFKDDSSKDWLGISNADERVFAIRSTTKTWPSTFFHEVGHIVLEHNNLLGLAQALGLIDPNHAEFEANLFAYFVTKELNLSMGAEGYRFANLINLATKELGIEIDPNLVEMVQAKAEEFVDAGRAG